MIYFPDYLPDPAWPFKEEYENTSITSKFEDGSMQSRTKFTKVRRKWILKWNNISRNDYLALMDFVCHTVKFSAKSFIWTNTDSIGLVEEDVEVRITSMPEWQNNSLNFWSGELELTEV